MKPRRRYARAVTSGRRFGVGRPRATSALRRRPAPRPRRWPRRKPRLPFIFRLPLAGGPFWLPADGDQAAPPPVSPGITPAAPPPRGAPAASSSGGLSEPGDTDVDGIDADGSDPDDSEPAVSAAPSPDIEDAAEELELWVDQALVRAGATGQLPWRHRRCRCR